MTCEIPSDQRILAICTCIQKIMQQKQLTMHVKDLHYKSTEATLYRPRMNYTIVIAVTLPLELTGLPS